ncbi:probable serine/threonine-protein kinase DDB_G0282963 isoform X2 [Anastrepha ludens]|nr:probable serine/threonine-protein kinase DDB_G0282963 isoform X2 [Anastrepha ludens]XP_053962497.1 probable serine/threonine-protein kinase DDB_G0282963 isoform X2 [Anastrepha ludens]
MSASLMSCVRENSPPLDVVDGAHFSSATGPTSLPDCHMSTMSTANQQQLTSTALTTSNVNESSSSGGGAGGGGDGTAASNEPKRRRFHPLRNLRRIFRRRTITSVTDTPANVNTSNTLPPPTSSTSEKNLRSATLSSISSVVSASSPSSPLTHQQLQDAYSSQSLPKSKSYSISGGGNGGSGSAASSGSVVKSPHRDALLATVLGGKHKHQQTKQQLQQQLEEVVNDSEMYTTTSSMYHHHQHQQVGSSGGVLFQPPHSVRQSLGVAVLPSAMNRSFYAERQKLRSVGDSSQELDSSGNDSGSATGTTSVNNTTSGSGSGSASAGRAHGCVSSEMTDSQRSLSEGRLVDSDYSHDPLSQSHDSVFSESASASLFSNRDYQAELSDVLRKRNRNRQDASEEDLGLPRSPASPQRHADRTHRNHHTASGSGRYSSGNHNNVATPSSATGNQSEVSSLSLLSMNSGDGEEILAASTANNSTTSTKEVVQDRSMTSSFGGRSITRSSTVSTTSVCSEIYRHSSSASLGSDSNRDEPDLLGAKCQRLSHSAAKHKMALRPAKKKGPSRQHRRTLETSIPEANEDSLRMAGNIQMDISEPDAKAKTRSLPPSVNTKILDKHVVDSKKTTSPLKSKSKSSASSNEQILNVKRSKIEKLEKSSESGKSTISTSTSTSSTSITAATNLFGLRTLTAKATALFEPPQESSTDPTPSEQELKKEKEKVKEKSSTNTGSETTESGFLRRLIQRNSKRSVSRSNPASNTNNSDNKDVVAVEVPMDVCQSEHEAKSKMQISTSCMDMKSTPDSSVTKLDKSRSALNYEQNIEETRKDIKREIMSVGNTGMNAVLNAHNMASVGNSNNNIKEPATSPQKPKSGAAARQRYMPQDIGSLDRKTNSHSTTTATTSESYASSTSSILSKCSQQEIFQSTSIIREITASHASSVNSVSSTHKSEHHFEKKPKIVGLSAFQQKISRSNDSVGRFASTGNSNANSTNSLDTAGDVSTYKSQEQKQRKLVEKSRSFRTYQDDAHSTTTAVHNNMPSLPDLTLNLRVPCYNDFALNTKDTAATTPDRSTSLGFEVNEQEAVRLTTPRTESAGNLTASSYNFSKNVVVKSSPTKLVALSQPSSSVAENDELESKNDLLAKSPFISVLRKPTSTTSLEEIPAVVTVCANNNKKSVEQNNATKKGSSISLVAVVPPTQEVAKMEQQQLRPKVLHLRDSNASIDTSTSTDDLKLTPSTAAVPLREKPKVQVNVTGGSIRTSMDILAANYNEVERKSAPTPVVQTNKAHSFKTTRRSSSLLDNPPNSRNASEERNAAAKTIEPTSGSSTPNDDGVPEFMRIQLNRVDLARIAKSANVVLAKNVRETHSPPQQQLSPQHQQPQQQQVQQQQHVTKEANERNSNLDDLNLRRLSNESVEIIEKSSPTEVDKQKPIFNMSQNSSSCGNNNSNNDNCKSPTKSHVLVSALPPRSPVKKQQSIVAITPTTPTGMEDTVMLRTKAPDTPADAAVLSSNKFSLQERKRLFMSEEKLKTDKRLEELRNERKKSITEEVYRKSFAKSEEKLETNEKAATESVVMLRKKSFCAITQAGAAATNGNRDDATPELMKVFARRSLKIKDEDINALADKIHANNCSTSSAKKFAATQQNVDSDKENQSASEEKLDKLPKLESSIESQTHVGGGKLTNGISNRNSLADFRTKSVVGNGTTISNGLSLNNSSNNNNNNNNHTAANSNNTTGGHTVNNTTANNVTVNATTNGISSNGGSGRSFLPPIKVAGFRTIPIERNNSVSKIYPTTACETLNNNNNNNSNNINNNNHHHNHNHHHQQNNKSNERQSLNVKMTESNSSAGSSNSSASSNSSTSSSNSNTNSKVIERSATVSEFKGIHQRRAEWEQRAKEALK